MLNRRAAVLMAAIGGASGLLSAPVCAADYWIGTWSTSPAGLAADAKLQEIGKLWGQEVPVRVVKGTIRYRMRVAEGGAKLRISLSNAHGDKPLTLGAVSVARAGAGRNTVPGTLRAVSFGGERNITIPIDVSVLSDPVDLSVTDGSDVLVSVYSPEGIRFWSIGPVNPLAASAIADGDVTAAESFTAKEYLNGRPIVSAIDVQVPAKRSVVVALGDSITDGDVAPDGERGWPGALARRLASKDISVVNAGIGGNRLLDMSPNREHLSAWARLDEDVFSVPGITHLIVLEGINDIGMSGNADNLVARMWGASPLVQPDELIRVYRQIIARAHVKGIKAIGATILPFDAAMYYSPDKESVRQAVNKWIRESREFDGVIDFDAGMRDPKAPSKLRKEFDPGDHLHPNTAGYRAMGEMIDLGLFK
jgi:lysophospholipase L1-like esterase